jgi:hypothetical protein
MVEKNSDRIDIALERVDAGKRNSLRKIVLGTAFAAPVVATFAVNGMMVISNSTIH